MGEWEGECAGDGTGEGSCWDMETGCVLCGEDGRVSDGGRRARRWTGGATGDSGDAVPSMGETVRDVGDSTLDGRRSGPSTEGETVLPSREA